MNYNLTIEIAKSRDPEIISLCLVLSFNKLLFISRMNNIYVCLIVFLTFITNVFTSLGLK